MKKGRKMQEERKIKEGWYKKRKEGRRRKMKTNEGMQEGIKENEEK